MSSRLPSLLLRVVTPMAGCCVLACLPFAIQAAVPVVESQPAGSRTVQLKYDAYVAGIYAGVARLTVERRTQTDAAPGTSSESLRYRYKVSGNARSKGLWESFQKWRAEYSVDGEVAQRSESAGAPRIVEPGHFYSLQTTPKKRREIHIEDGVLKETKNHKVRDPRPAQTGFDLLSALFALPPCHPQLRVHTGRDGYEMQRTRPAPQIEANAAGEPVLQCRYRVEDEEGDSYQMSLAYEGRGEFVVPAEIAVQGPLNGRMVLASDSERSPDYPDRGTSSE